MHDCLFKTLVSFGHKPEEELLHRIGILSLSHCPILASQQRRTWVQLPPHPPCPHCSFQILSLVAIPVVTL